MSSLSLDPVVNSLPTRSAKHVADAYDSSPWWYDVRGFFILTLAYQASLWGQVRFFAANIRRRHLEVGVGTGTLLWLCLWFLRLYQRSWGSIVAVDCAAKMLEGARRRFARWPGVVLLHQDVAKMAPEELGFDSINIANAFHRLSEPDQTLKLLHRALAPDGTLALNVLMYPMGRGLRAWVATTINRWGMRKAILVRPYFANDVRVRVEQAGFVVVHESFSGNCMWVVAKKR